MKSEYTEQDFANGVRNPYFEKMNRKTEISLRNEVYFIFSKIGEQNGVAPEVIMRRCLTDYANRLIESDD